MFRALENIPKKDRRYLRLLHRQTAVRVALVVFLAGFIVLGGYGISRIKSERVDAYNGLVEEQISLIEAGDYEGQEQVFEEASRTAAFLLWRAIIRMHIHCINRKNLKTAFHL